jgi:hypothetical protein
MTLKKLSVMTKQLFLFAWRPAECHSAECRGTDIHWQVTFAAYTILAPTAASLKQASSFFDQFINEMILKHYLIGDQ